MNTVTAQEDLSVDDAHRAIAEVDTAMEQTEGLLSQSGLVAATAAAKPESREITAADVEVLRDRARKQRRRGQQQLERRYEGISSVVKSVTINERVVGSAFERFFPIIENGIFVIQKRGELFLTPSAFETVMKQITEKIEKADQDVGAALAAVSSQTNDAQNTVADWIAPMYTQASAKHEVQVRSPLALRVLNVFVKEDQVIAGLQALLWNGEMEMGKIEDEEHRHKKDMSDLAKLVARTLRGMRNKVSAAIPTAPADAAPADKSPAEALEAA